MYTYVAGQCGHETGESTRTTAVSWLKTTLVLENPLSSQAADFTRPIEGPRQRVGRTAVGDLVECRHGPARLTGTFIESRTYVGFGVNPLVPAVTGGFTCIRPASTPRRATSCMFDTALMFLRWAGPLSRRLWMCLPTLEHVCSIA